ncbi:gamma-aminobutyrate permease-like transporter [Desulfosporosinus acidiphilus SJ4]|uniref:Gamma-aminobutyrate permease-like transporter n=1 Tax=Desulfosporosinus acidiphilus (strain DSM 22704 / JCM 16185 / SJ4) TaxID=646529 RepID=I4DAL9_DESAJ|nr:amino acid permease [Desulfosporosinus acidiphilus]AFM42843.1 gamma-aminobutyrate permease-like transporter [Desulfosporosinus acidiphilus SJ4]
MSTNQDHDMQRGLKNRHIQMIALGGAIGTGLFYGSAETIKLAGPAITLSYMIGGFVIFLIMRMLGEMSVDEPVSGSFSHFAYKYWGEFPGFLSGWNYWFNYVIVSMAELTAVGIYINYWFPSIPHWASALFFLIIITAANLVNVKMYGEFEFWFAIIKVVAILGMIIFGLLLIFTKINGQATGFSNLWIHGGYIATGWWGVILSLVPVMFSFGGIELIGITAGEADNPKKTIPKAINQVMWRILIFYVGALTVMMILYPWNQVGMDGSPFVQIFSKMGIPAAASILNVVVLTAALSVYNSGIYSNGRMLYSLAQQGNAPKSFAKLNSNGIPVRGVLISSALTLVAVILNYLIPGKIFMYLMSIAIIAGIINWTMIIFTNLKFRKAKGQAADNLEFKTPLHPISNYAAFIFLAIVVALMSTINDMKMAVYILPVWILVLWIGFKFKKSSESKISPAQKAK